MLFEWCVRWLTVSQVLLLAGALPRPQASVTAVATTEATSYVTSVITIGEKIVTSTSLNTTQTPTTTSATGSLPDTTGSVQVTLETAGGLTAYPFPLPTITVTSATLSALDGIVFPLANATEVPTTTTWTTEFVTIPTTTHVTFLETTTVSTATITVVATVVSYTTLPYTTTVSGSLSTGSTVSSSLVTYTSTQTSLATATLTTTSSSTGAATLTTATASTAAASAAASATASSLLSGTTTDVNCTDNMGCSGQNIFLPVALSDVPSNIEKRDDHPVAKLGINQTTPVETNKFYANFFLGTQADTVFTHPYSLEWSKGSGNAMSYGMSISHIDDDQKVDGPVRTDIPGSPVSYYINPIGIQSMILSAAELGNTTVLTSDTLLAFSANINLLPTSGSSSKLTFPVVQGMGFVTGLYENLQPAIQSSVFFRTVVAAGSPKTGVYKYRIQLEDGNYWLIYAIPSDGVDPNFELQSSTLIQGLPSFTGAIQIAKNPGNASEELYDSSAGVYPTSTTISGFASGSTGSYSFAWSKGGLTYSNNSLLMFALPHHVQSMTPETQQYLTNLTLNTTTKGMATAVFADSWTLEEPDLPTNMGFAPWRPNSGSSTNFSEAAIAAINATGAVEVSQNMTAQADLNSMYYSGKALSKFATLIWTLKDVAQNDGLAAAGLANLKAAFAIFVNQQQPYPLVYDEVWGGVVSSASYVTGNSGEDFGNTYYNDHHFHYGYHVHAAAVIGSLDPTWLTDNQDYVNTLVRDASNPSLEDTYFPFSRSFDWYHGHSWAKGLFESGDSKDQESTSEDAMFSYALKMWGQTIGDASMEARGNMMLAIQARSFQNYFYLESTNVNQPSNFIDNKVTGILFENKVDHTTYFGNNLEYIEGIHMIPLMPFSTLTRNTDFVSEEWNAYFTDGAVDPASNVTGGWKGLLYANLAIINPTASWDFFNQSDFDDSWLDGGATRTWYLAFAAGLGATV